MLPIFERHVQAEQYLQNRCFHPAMSWGPCSSWGFSFSPWGISAERRVAFLLNLNCFIWYESCVLIINEGELIWTFRNRNLRTYTTEHDISGCKTAGEGKTISWFSYGTPIYIFLACYFPSSSSLTRICLLFFHLFFLYLFLFFFLLLFVFLHFLLIFLSFLTTIRNTHILLSSCSPS